MVDQVANLGIKVDSTTVVKADKDLDHLADTSKRAEKATDSFTGSTKRATDVLVTETGAIGRNESATKRLTASNQKATGAIGRNESATKRLTTSNEKATGSYTTQSTAIGRNESATKRLTASNEKATGVIGRNESATRKLTASNQKATGSFTTQSTAIRKTNVATQALTQSQTVNTKVTNAMASAWRSMAVVVAGFAGIQGARALRDISDESINIQNRLRQVTDTTEELNATFARLVKLSAETRVSLSSTSVLYQRLSLSSQDLNLSQSELLRLTETINKSFAISGATASEAAGAIRQLSQGLAAGALRGDEFNSVAEQAPAIMRAIADETGMALGELREFAATGGITADIIISALQGAENEIDINFAKSVATFGQQMEQINNEFIQWAANSEGLRESMSALGDILGVLATATIFLLENLDLIAVVMIAKLAPSIQATATAWIAYSVAARTAITVTGVLSGAMALLGGPVGVALLAAFAIWKFIESVETAEEKTARLTAEVGDLSDQFKDLTQSELALESVKTAASFNKISMSINKVKGVIADLKFDQMGFDEMSMGSARASTAIVRQQKVLKGLNKELIRLGVVSDTISEAQNKIFDTRIDKLFAETEGHSAELEKTLAKVFTKYGDLISVVGMTARETAKYNDIIRNGIELKSAEGQALEEVIDIYFDQVDAIKAAEKATKELEKAAIESAEAQQKAYEKAFDFTSDLFEDTINNWEDGWKGFADNVVGIIKKMLARIAAEYLASGVLQLLGITGAGGGSFASAGLSLGGLGAGGAGSPSSTAGTIANLARVGKSIYDNGAAAFAGAQQVYAGFASGGLSGGFDAFGAATGLFGGAEAGAALFGGGAGGGLAIDLGTQASGFAVAADSLATGIAEAAPWASALAGALKGFNQSGAKGAVAGAAGGFFGAQAGAQGGAAIGTSVGGPVGGAIGAAIGAIVGGLVGAELGSKIFGGSFQTRDFGIQLAVAAGDLVADSFEKQKKEGGLFGKTKKRTLIRDLDLETNLAFTSAIEGTQRRIIDSYGILGIELGEDVFKSFSSATVRISTKGKSDEKITAALNKYFEGITEQMLGHIGLLSGLTFERLTELATVLQFANTALGALGLDLINSSKSGAEAAENLVLIAGGFEAFQMSVTNFNDKFVEQRSDFEIATSVLTDIFGVMGSELPQTRTAVTDLVSGLDLMTNSGQTAFAIITGLSLELDAYYTELERLENERIEDAERVQLEELRAAEQLAAKRTILEIELLHASGAAIEALAAERERELSAMDESLRPIQERIFALQDEAVAAEEVAKLAKEQTDLNIKLLKEQGDLTEALAAERERELASMDESLRPIQERIFALQDEAAAAKKATEAVNNSSNAFKKSFDAVRTTVTGNIENLKSVSEAISDIINVSNNPTRGAAKQIIRDAISSAKTGVFANLDDISPALKVLSQSSENSFASLIEFTRDQATTAALLSELQSLTDNELSIQEQALSTLDAMDDNLSRLVEIENGTHVATLTLLEAVNGLSEALGITSPSVPSFANGGSHSGGLRLVGERGPELESTGRSNIMSNANLSAMLSGGSTLAELQAIRAELKRTGFAVARNTLQIRKLLDRWDGDGLPAERVV